MNQTMRPSILPDNKKLVAYPLVVCLIISAIGIAEKNLVVVILPLIILAVFPGLPVFFHLLFYLFVKIELYPHKIIVRDYTGNKIVKFPSVQEIAFADIRYIYYLGKEINLLKNLAGRLKKYNLSPKENNFTRENLVAKYNVPAETIEQFEKSSRNILNDFTATAVLMMLDDFYRKYNMPKQTAKNIRRELEYDENFNYEFVREKLKDYPLETEDLDRLKDEFENIKADIIRPFLLTKVNLEKYKKISHSRSGASITAKADIALVLASKNGTEKLYFMHFHDLSRTNWRSLMQTIKNNNPNITCLMTKNEYNSLLT